MRLTDITIRNLPTPTKGQVIHLCETVTGFGVRVSQGGAKTYVLTYGKERRRITLGRVGIVSLAEARDVARRHLAERILGTHRTRSVPFAEARTAFFAFSKSKNRDSTHKGYKSRLDRVSWGQKNLTDIAPREVLSEIDKFGPPMERRYAFVVLRAFFNWCVQNHYLDASPLERMATPPNNQSRERVLSSDELKAIWDACPDNSFGRTVKLLILTGQRRGEVEHITLEGDVATIPAAFTKNKRTHTFPLSASAGGLLATPLKWAGWGKSKARLDAASNVTNWTLHDLRRTYATIHAQLGSPPHIIEALLNHKSGIVSGVAATYNRYRYLDEMREAVRNFDIHIEKILS